MKRIKIVFIIIFSIIIMIPLLFINVKENVISEIDNRNLVEVPKFDKFNREYLLDWDKYFNDRYAGREQFIDIYSKIDEYLFGELSHPIYMYGEDGHIFLRLTQEINYSSYHEKFADSLSIIKNYLEKNGTKFYVMINPEKASVYKDYLPKGVNYNRKWQEEFEKMLSSKGITFIDNTEELTLRSEKDYVYNKKYDAGHWNDIGAFYGVNNLLKLINKDYSNVKPLTFEDFEISKVNEHYLKLSKFPINEEVPVLTLKNSENYIDLTSDYIEKVKLDNNYPIFSYIKNGQDKSKLLPKVLVFQGSYLNGREKYLQSRFSDYIAIHNYQNIFNIEEYFEIFKPDIVIFEVAEYTFSDLYFSEKNMGRLIDRRKNE